ncbi:HAMP domain-containing sensor histidine kinase [Crocosphaera sp.]|uniref:sensor histidine kinase n=1 Tax=Crocosphaera sp. TaxID=2729996 RepID=UPI00262312BB|nr:HAMP domain-containing sensor histidine kinase [Crocosphaera sp.]MDJ0582645.1 HAMP domain-containing sensor histidine kinase [Crocosphaera sp.]
MSNSSKDNNIEKSLINAIIARSDYDRNLENIAEIIREELLVDFCLIITNFNDLQYFYSLRNSPIDNSIMHQSKLSELIQNPWIQELKNGSNLRYIRDLKHKKYHKLSVLLEGIILESLLGISTHFKGENNGIILVGKSTSYQWNSQDKNKLKEVVNIVSIACHLNQVNAMVDEKSINKDSSFSLGDIPQLLQENPILRLWWKSTRQQLEKQLEWNRKVIYNMITIMSDQTRNPLAILKMGITVLKTRELSPKELSKRIAMLEDSWNKLNSINEKILQLKHLKSENMSYNLVPVNLTKLLINITNSCQEKWQENLKSNLTLNTNFNIQGEESLRTDVQHLTNIIEELLKNASKFSVPNSTVTLEVNQENNHNKSLIAITLSNISEYGFHNNISEFFEPFYREQIVIDSGIPGIGVGLNIVKDLVKLLQGKISVECLPTENPKHCKIIFRLVLPQSLSSS